MRKCIKEDCDTKFDLGVASCPSCNTEWNSIDAGKKARKIYYNKRKSVEVSDTDSESEESESELSDIPERVKTNRAKKIRKFVPESEFSDVSVQTEASTSEKWLEEEKSKLKKRERDLIEKSEMEFKLYRTEADKYAELKKKLEEELNLKEKRRVEVEKRKLEVEEGLNKITSEKDKEIERLTKLMIEKNERIKQLGDTILKRDEDIKKLGVEILKLKSDKEFLKGMYEKSNKQNFEKTAVLNTIRKLASFENTANVDLSNMQMVSFPSIQSNPIQSTPGTQTDRN